MRYFFSIFFSIFFYLNIYSQCLQIDIEVLAEPFCSGSFNGGQLKANVTNGSGSYSYQWLNSSGGYLPGGPQFNQTTLSFLSINQEIWVYVTDNLQNCTDSASYMFTSYSCQPDTARLEVASPFTINPVGYNTYTQCNVQLTNLGCQLTFSPEFIISHQTEDIEPDDFIIEYYNAQSNWQIINYSIDSLGRAVGFWGNQSGENLNCDEIRNRPVRVKFNQFNPAAPTGLYTAILRLWSVDGNGNLIDIVSEEAQVSINLIDTICNNLSIQSTLTDATCSSQSDGAIEVHATGGLSPYQYSLNGSSYSSDSIFDGLSYGQYILSVKDDLGCQIADTIFLNPVPLLPDSIWFNNISSFSANINWDADSLVDGYRFRYRLIGQSWQIVSSGFFDDGLADLFTSKELTNLLPASVYEVQVKINSLTDCQEGWSSSFFFNTLIEPYSYVLVNACNETNSGQINFNVETSNTYSFVWDGPNGFISTESVINSLDQGSYNLSIFNDTLLIFDSTFSIISSSSHIEFLNNESFDFIDVNPLDYLQSVQLCQLNIPLYAQSGFSNYIWSNGSIGQQIVIDESDVYLQVEALDSNNCPSFSDSLYITFVSDYSNLVQANNNQTYIEEHYFLCSNDSLEAIDVSDFYSGNFSYQWLEIVNQDSVFISDSSIVYLAPTQSANYTLEISNCFLDFSIEVIDQPSLEVFHTDVLCNSDSNGTLIMLADTALNFFHFTVENEWGSILYDSTSSQFADTLYGLPAGFYLVQLQNEWMCTNEHTIEVQQADLLQLDNVVVSNVVCNGDSSGAINYTVVGGTAPYQYQINSDTILSANQLPAGDYSLKIIDANQCLVDTFFSLNDPPELSLSIIDSLTQNVSCFGNNDGQFSIYASGGVLPYSYELNGEYMDTTFFSDLLADTFLISVSDQIGCYKEISINITQPLQELFIESWTLSDTLGYCSLCYGDSLGTIEINLVGGSPSYSYFIVDQPMVFSNPVIENLLGGQEYQFYAKDSLGCVTDTIVVECNSPENLVFTTELISLPSCCFSCDAQINCSVTGGILPYQYSNDNIFFQTDSVFDQLCGDSSYYFVVKDSLGCQKTIDTFFIPNISCLNIDTLNFVNNQYPAIITDSCQTEGTAQIYVTASGGTPNYHFSISDTTNFIESQQYVFNNLSQGQYLIIVKDSMNCLDSIHLNIEEITPINIDISYDTVYCTSPYINNQTNQSDLGAFLVQASGSFTNTYTYSLDQLDSSSYTSSGIFSNLDSTFYTLNVKDGNDCISEFEINIPYLDLEFDYTIYEISCADAQDGSLEVNNLTSDAYAWVTVDGQFSNTNMFTDLDDGWHEVISYYSYTNGECFYEESFELINKEPLEVSSVLSNASCFGFCDASISIESYNGGSAPYTFVCLNNLDTNLVFENLCAGNYVIKMTDSNGCFILEELELLEANPIYPIITYVNNELMVTQPTLENPTSGLPPYSYQWFLEDTLLEDADSSIHNPNTIGSYYVLVTDSNQCQGQSSEYNIEVLSQEDELKLMIDVFPNPVINDLNVITQLNEAIYWEFSHINGTLITSGENDFTWTIKTQSLSKGTYILQLFITNQPIIYKIIKL